jgi:hypothetical protein
MVGENNEEKPGEYKINLLGEYNIGGDGFEIDRILRNAASPPSPPFPATRPTISSPRPTRRT